MMDGTIFAIVSATVWLLLAGSAFASFRLGWGKTIQMALIWVAIFAGGFVIASFFMN